jgi:hypothetical protein
VKLLKEFFQKYQEAKIKTGKDPKVKVNKEWYQKQLQSTFVLRNDNEKVLYGIPVEFDDNVDTFTFEFKEE